MRGVIDDTPLVNIATAIREKTGTETTYKPAEMPGGVAEVYEAGKKAQHNEFWNSIWNNLTGNNQRAFVGPAWSKETFRPNKDFTISVQGFYYHNWLGTAYDLAAHLEGLGVTMKLGTNSKNSCFYYAWFTRLPKLDFSECSGTFDRIFYGASKLVTIDKIILPPEGTIISFNTVFYGCDKLKNVLFDGIIDKSISFSDCPLTVESMKNIISCLKDYSLENAFTYTLTLSDSCKTALEADTEKVEFNGQSYTYFELITAKGWNLA